MENRFDFTDKVSLITGATGNIGRCITDNIFRTKSEIILLDKDIKKLQDLASKYETNKIHIIEYDALDDNLVDDALCKINMITKKIDHVVNTIGMVGTDKDIGWTSSFESQSKESWNKCLEINLTSIFFLIQQLLPLLKKGFKPSIVNISSIYGLIGPDFDLYQDTNMNNPAAYGVSKAGLIQLTRWLAASLSPDIRVNCISPGGIYRDQPKKFVERYNKKTLVGRMASESEISDSVLFLLSNMSSYITGQNIVVDGGFIIK